jgi:hypothetical protein
MTTECICWTIGAQWPHSYFYTLNGNYCIVVIIFIFNFISKWMWYYTRDIFYKKQRYLIIYISQCIWLYKKCSLWWEGPYERALTVYRHIEQSIWHYKGTKKNINYKVPLLLVKYISCIIPHSFGYKIEYKYNNHNTIISIESIKVRIQNTQTRVHYLNAFTFITWTFQKFVDVYYV